MLHEEMRKPRGDGAAASYSQVGDSHRFAARFIEPARQQNLIRQWAAAYVAERIQKVKDIEHSQTGDDAEPCQRASSQQYPNHHQSPRTKSIHNPPGKVSKHRPHNQLTEGVA